MIMSEGKGNSMFAAMLFLGMLLQVGSVHSATYTVGDESGWRFGVAGWEKGKQFKAGDTLVFKYSPSHHNVVAVNKAGYDSCNFPSDAKTYASGNDNLRLSKGANYFICGIPGHCGQGMKIAAFAA